MFFKKEKKQSACVSSVCSMKQFHRLHKIPIPYPFSDEKEAILKHKFSREIFKWTAKKIPDFPVDPPPHGKKNPRFSRGPHPHGQLHPPRYVCYLPSRVFCNFSSCFTLGFCMAQRIWVYDMLFRCFLFASVMDALAGATTQITNERRENLQIITNEQRNNLQIISYRSMTIRHWAIWYDTLGFVCCVLGSVGLWVCVTQFDKSYILNHII